MVKIANEQSFRQFKEQLDEQGVTLVAISKTKSIDQIKEVYSWGQRIFGENRAQELHEKSQALPKDIAWHMVGHIQRNKVKYFIDDVALIHSIDRISVLQEVNKQASKLGKTVAILLQVYIATEETKHGFSWDELNDLLQNSIQDYRHVRVCGLMGMATNTTNQAQVQQEFAALNDYYETINNEYYANDNEFSTLSMGMSGDYELAIEAGSNMIRIGSLIFGSR